MFTTRRTFNHIALMAAGAEVLFRSTPAEALAGSTVVGLQPLAAQVKRLVEALQMLGTPLSHEETTALQDAFNSRVEADGVAKIQQILDEHVLLNIQIPPEDRYGVTRGRAKTQLIEHGWRSFLIKVFNETGNTSALAIVCPEAQAVGRMSNAAVVPSHYTLDEVVSQNRWIALDLWDKPPLQRRLSGLPIEYGILQLYSRDHGQREAGFHAHIIAGTAEEKRTQFFAYMPVSFDCLSSKDLPLKILDENGQPTTASLVITDALGRVYPAEGKRELPDLWFERQIYRRDGETVCLPAGNYNVEYGRGPEYLYEKMMLAIGTSESNPMKVDLKRWVRPYEFGYYSGDTHIHAAGCAHYESPTQGVPPEVMYRQVQGEALDLGDVLTWGPGFYYQRRFFTGHVEQFASGLPVLHPSSSASTAPLAKASLLRYDIETSGFPSSHCGHLVLLRLKDQNYPGATTLDDWPSWNIPILKWARSQGSLAGYAHSGGGLIVDSEELPNYEIPPFNGAGANEYIVDVTHGVVDFISTCDTVPQAELNIWYHTLNCGFRVPLAGETDFPCLTDDRTGGGRSYVKLDKRPVGDAGYSNWISGLKAGRSYVGDGRSHIFDFNVRMIKGAPAANRQLSIAAGTSVQVTAQVCARLEPEITEATKHIANASSGEIPRWHLERARIGQTRKVAVELVVNGIAVQRSDIEADGTVHALHFDVTIDKSSWITLRIMPSAHTSPIYILVNNAPIRASQASAAWCRKGIDVCWEQKAPRMRAKEIGEAKAAYDYARSVYEQIIAESKA